MTELTANQKEVLEHAMAEREKRLNRVALKKSEVEQKKNIAPAEYQRRLLLEIEKDNKDAETRIQSRYNKNVSLWNRKVGERFRDATTTVPDVLERVERLRRGNTHKTSFALFGNLGVGKTWLAYAYLNTLVKEGIMTPANIVASTETSTLGRIATGGFERSNMFKELKNPVHKIFFIDDVGQAHFTREESRHEVWYELIDHVYSNDLTLILTTNKTFQNASGGLNNSSLQRWLGDAAYDRMKHIMGPTGLIIPGDKNHRPQVYKERDEKE